MRIANMDLSLHNPKEAKKYLQLLLISRYEKYPFFTNMLINMADIEDVHPEQKGTSLAYTYFDHHLQRLKIRINFDWIEDGVEVLDSSPNVIEVLEHGVKKGPEHGENVIESGTELTLNDVKNMGEKKKRRITFNNDNVLFLIYHELLHNFFHHFTRHARYREKYATLANIVEDFYINEFLKRLFSNINNFSSMPNDFSPIMYDELNRLANRHCKQNLPFSHYEDKPLESTLIDWFIQFENQWGQDIKDGAPNPGGNVTLDKNKGTGNHGVSQEYSERSLASLNKEREAAGKSRVSKEEAGNIASKKIDEAVDNAKDMSGKNLSEGEKECCRHRSKILKKDPFLNYVKITNTLKKMMVKGTFKNYSKPNRRRNSNSVVYKAKSKEEGLHIVVGVDVSGSVSDKELAKIYDMLGTFFDKNATSTSIDIFYWSSCRLEAGVHFYEDITDSKHLLKLKVNSSGGTILSTAHDFLEEHYGKRKIQFLNITDGYFSFAPVPACVSEYFFCLTESGTEIDVKKWFPKAKVRVCRVDGD
ncbi:MAG: hypothetical protein ACRC0G_14280 [Fusobacteriaceae bacterium]